MQIDVLSQNTLKLTLSRLDMFDLDIKYETLSGKNPDTKRLLSHVLRTVRLDKGSGVDFSGERLFVEAFPRPDGGCMLYISNLNEENKGKPPAVHRPRTHTLNIKPRPREQSKSFESSKSILLCRFDSVKELDGACKSLAWQSTNSGLRFESALYENQGEYRLLLRCDNRKLVSSIIAEYGESLNPDYELPFTYEHYNLLTDENAVEKMSMMNN